MLEFNAKEDIIGPLTMAFAATKIIEKPEVTKKGKKEGGIISKLVVVGDSSFVNNVNLDFADNNTLFLNMINWLCDDEDLISIERPKSKANIIKLLHNTRKLFYYLFLGLIPGIIFFTGLYIWWKKRKL